MTGILIREIFIDCEDSVALEKKHAHVGEDLAHMSTDCKKSVKNDKLVCVCVCICVVSSWLTSCPAK